MKVIEFFVIEIFVVALVAAFLWYWFKSKSKPKPRSEATFIGGPLDSTTKKFVSFPAVYTVFDRQRLGTAVYKHEGNGLYSFDEYIYGLEA
jgi:hypothetical protein